MELRWVVHEGRLLNAGMLNRVNCEIIVNEEEDGTRAFHKMRRRERPPPP